VIREVLRRFEEAGFKAELTLFQVEYSATATLYRHQGRKYAIRQLPTTIAHLRAFDCYVDLSEQYPSSDAPQIDEMLRWAGLIPDDVPATMKRNCLSIPDATKDTYAPMFDILRKHAGKILIVHSMASIPERSMPSEALARLVQDLLEHTDYTIVTLCPMRLCGDRALDLSLIANTFWTYSYCISQADAFVTVDTSLFHVADAFNIPGVVLFTVEPIARWASYYPFVTGVQVSAPVGLEMVCRDTLSRDWDALSTRDVVTNLNNIVKYHDTVRSSSGTTH